MSKTEAAKQVLREFLASEWIEERSGGSVPGPALNEQITAWATATGRDDLPTLTALGRAWREMGFAREKIGGAYCRVGLRVPQVAAPASAEDDDYQIDPENPAPPPHLSRRAAGFMRWILDRASLTHPQLALLISCCEHWDLSQRYRRLLDARLSQAPESLRDHNILHRQMVAHSDRFASQLAMLGLEGEP